MKKIVSIIAVIVLVIILAFMWLWFSKEKAVVVNNFQECVAVGNPVMESYPRQCIHDGVNYVEELPPNISLEEAIQIALNSEECLLVGDLQNEGLYNAISRTWWFDLNRDFEAMKDGCSPACVVFDDSLTTEVNWRCTGLNLPEETEID